ncbi:MAG: hypothetical protein JNK24_08010 [Alphaproteobacteria bacterium]|nr:hypothetical protein [Alphaproteobacteria bacterium]
MLIFFDAVKSRLLGIERYDPKLALLRLRQTSYKQYAQALKTLMNASEGTLNIVELSIERRSINPLQGLIEKYDKDTHSFSNADKEIVKFIIGTLHRYDNIFTPELQRTLKEFLMDASYVRNHAFLTKSPCLGFHFGYAYIIA